MSERQVQHTDGSWSREVEVTDPLLDEATRLMGDYREGRLLRALVKRVQQAEAQRDRLKRGGATLGKALDDALWDIAKATRSTGLLDETRDGDWGLIFDRLATLGDRAETAAAERDEARGKLNKVRAYIRQHDETAEMGREQWGADVLAILDDKAGT